MPMYQCHKKVWALKIESVDYKPGDMAGAGEGWWITPADHPFAPFMVDTDFVHKHNPKAGGYYVVYRDGYKSYSPAEAFESGYTRL